MGLVGPEDSPGGPCGPRPSGRILVRILSNSLSDAMMHHEILNLLDAPDTGEDAPSLDHIEHTLTAGYARALALEAQRWRLERKIAEVAAQLGRESGEKQTSQLARLGEELSTADGSLSQLRGLLSSLRTRADEVRTIA